MRTNAGTDGIQRRVTTHEAEQLCVREGSSHTFDKQPASEASHEQERTDQRRSNQEYNVYVTIGGYDMI